MIDAATWTVIQHALLCLLFAVASALLAVLAPVLFRWLNALADHVKNEQARATIHGIVRGLEQSMADASGALKKDKALQLVAIACPWLPSSVASVFIEAAVYTLPKALNDDLHPGAALAVPPPTTGGSASTAPVTMGRRADDRT